jgi:prepilin-type N-terminal cleavage/methylation domain-containing protein
MGSKRGFTLLEMSVALAVAGVITAAALTATVSIQRSFTTMRKRVTQADELRVTAEYVLERLRLAGGGLVRPWQAISVSCANDPQHPMPVCNAAKHQRRVHLLELAPVGQGVIASVSGNTVTVNAPGGACPLTTANGYVGATPVVLVPAEARLAALGGATWRTGLCTPAAVAGPCQCTLQTVGQPGFNAPPAAGGSIPDADFQNGAIARGSVTTFFVDPATTRLKMHKDFGGTGVAESTAIVPGAVAFDVRLGYDNDNDGVINSLQATPDLTSVATMRTVRIGLAVSTPSPDGRALTARLFGDVVGAAGQLTLSTEGTALMRASGVFQ